MLAPFHDEKKIILEALDCSLDNLTSVCTVNTLLYHPACLLPSSTGTVHLTRTNTIGARTTTRTEEEEEEEVGDEKAATPEGGGDDVATSPMGAEEIPSNRGIRSTGVDLAV